jgi:hypothetical protein
MHKETKTMFKQLGLMALAIVVLGVLTTTGVSGYELSREIGMAHYMSVADMSKRYHPVKALAVEFMADNKITEKELAKINKLYNEVHLKQLKSQIKG